MERQHIIKQFESVTDDPIRLKFLVAQELFFSVNPDQITPALCKEWIKSGAGWMTDNLDKVDIDVTLLFVNGLMNPVSFFEKYSAGIRLIYNESNNPNDLIHLKNLETGKRVMQNYEKMRSTFCVSPTHQS